jgi:hypothetical protein
LIGIKFALFCAEDHPGRIDMTQQAIWPRLSLLVFLVTTLFLTTSCVTGTSRNNGKTELSDKQKYDILSEEYRNLRKEYDQISKNGCSGNRDLENRISQLNTELIERDNQIEKIAARAGALQKKLDEAIQEVVRAKAKLRSLESRAETATSIAETEIALKALKVQQPGGHANPNIIQAEQLLAMSSQEFKKKNYSGALYLVNQAKDNISKAQMRVEGEKMTDTLLGEVSFAKPLNLRVTKKSNVREGPGLYFRIVAIVKPSTPLTGYSFKGQWLRVKGENGVGGWIYQDLVSGR